MSPRVVVTGMSVVSPVADTLDGLLDALLAGRSAITRWRTLDVSRCYAKIGGDLGDYDVEARAAALLPTLPPPVAERLHRLLRRVPHAPGIGLLLSAGAVAHAGLTDAEAAAAHVVVSGHNLADAAADEGYARFAADPTWLDASHELYQLDTTQAACTSELLASHGPAYTVGGACASGNLALLAAYREIVRHGAPRAVVLGAIPDFSVRTLHGFALLQALSIQSFNDAPERASRPWDLRREGFVAAHAGAALVLEDRDAAIARGARIHAELCGVGVCSDANHLTLPDAGGQARAMTLALRRAGVAPEEVDFVSAHATSTPGGDLVEIRALRAALGPHADTIKINAPKSLLGHSFGAAALVEAVAAILQANAGVLHGTRNIDALDPAVDLDVCASGPVRHPVGCFLNDAFGFGGINAVSVFRSGS